MSLHTEVLADPAALTARAVALIEDEGARSISENGHFVVSLAGGSTPRQIYTYWGRHSTLAWEKLHLLYGDERCVPYEHADSNAGMVRDTLLEQLATQPIHHRIAGEDPEPKHAAAAYEQLLKQVQTAQGGIDLALLGIGADGHTASLFPGAAALDAGASLCINTLGPDGSRPRITLTVAALQKGRRLLFMAVGAEKAAILKTVLEGPIVPQQYPCQFFLRDEALDVTLLLDQAAAAGLAKS